MQISDLKHSKGSPELILIDYLRNYVNLPLDESRTGLGDGVEWCWEDEGGGVKGRKINK